MTAQPAERSRRYLSHAILEVRKLSWWPFNAQSGILLDISLQGFKIEFAGEFIPVVGKSYHVRIPLTPFAIHSPKFLPIRAECRWFDEKKFRFGAVFTEVDSTQKSLIELMIHTLMEREKELGLNFSNEAPVQKNEKVDADRSEDLSK